MNIEKLIKKNHIRTNSKDIQKGDIFFCTLGLVDKNKYIDEALERGASLVISNTNYDNKKVIKVNDLDNYLREMLDLKYQYPLNNTTLIGVTGTDGKTTTASLIRMMLMGASIGTNGLEYNNRQFELSNTTPSLDHLYEAFYQIKKKKINNIVMEVSSESYLTKRIPTLQFQVGIFLNISKEHLDKHKDFNNYLGCKKKLLLNSKIKIINRDTKYFKEIVKDLDSYLTFGFKKSDLQIINYQLFLDKTIIEFKYQEKNYTITSPLLGKYNIDNLMAAILCLLSLGYDIEDVIKRIRLIKTIPGRMETLSFPKKIFIDYAHTEHATKEVLMFLDKYICMPIILVIGCAGGRYKEKRSIIGKLALKYAKTVVFTSDDPRWEDPKTIIQEMIGKTRKKNYEIIISREEAINKALDIAKDNELIVILGKGRDNYMAIKNELITYSDIDVIQKYFKKM